MLLIQIPVFLSLCYNITKMSIKSLLTHTFYLSLHLQRPKTSDALCKECFFWAFEEEVHHTITAAKLLTPGDYVAVAASGIIHPFCSCHPILLHEKKCLILIFIYQEYQNICSYVDVSLSFQVEKIQQCWLIL